MSREIFLKKIKKKDKKKRAIKRMRTKIELKN
jgi:hypothetical protein